MSDDAPQRLSRALQALHRALLASEADAAGIPAEPYKRLGAAMADPRLAWLGPLLKLIVALEEDDDSGALADPAAQRAWGARAQTFLASDPAFAAPYAAALARSPTVAALDAEVRAPLAELIVRI